MAHPPTSGGEALAAHAPPWMKTGHGLPFGALATALPPSTTGLRSSEAICFRLLRSTPNSAAAVEYACTEEPTSTTVAPRQSGHPHATRMQRGWRACVEVQLGPYGGAAGGGWRIARCVLADTRVDICHDASGKEPGDRIHIHARSFGRAASRAAAESSASRAAAAAHPGDLLSLRH